MAKKKLDLSKAIKHPGALRKKAEAAGAIHDGKIDKSWLEAKAKSGDPTTQKQARLAIIMSHMKH